MRRHSILVSSAIIVLLVLAVALAGDSKVVTQKANSPSLGFWTTPSSAAALERECQEALDHARALRDQIIAVQGKRTVQNTLVPYDEITRYIGRAANAANLLLDTHPDASFRQVGSKMAQAASALQSEIVLDPRIYRAIGELSQKNLDAETSYYLSRILKNFRNSGVDKPDDVRQKIAESRAEIIKLQQQFNRNIVQGVAWMPFRLDELEGVPEDFLRSRKRDEQGKYLISNDRAEFQPVTYYAKNPETRRKVEAFYGSRAYPANMRILDQLIRSRRQLAALCGFSTYADMTVQNRMVGSEAAQRRFLDEIDHATHDAAEKQLAVLLEAKRRDQAGATSVDQWDVAYYIRRVREQKYGFDEQEVRAYYPYTAVKESVFQISSRMFKISFRPAKVPVWHPTVEVYDVLENGSVIGRIYLDMFPRPDKYQHFRNSFIRAGVFGRQLPEGALICNMSAPAVDDPALMTADLAVTFFHEFGHLLHGIFSGHQRWAGLGLPEADFIEAPSQLLEEWYRNPKVLAGFARHYKTGDAIPERLVENMARASNFGEALLTRRQLWLANIALAYASGNGEIDTDAIARDFSLEYAMVALVEGAHPQCPFTHLALPGYAGAYYTYQWSLVIAKDLFTKFNRDNLLDPKVAARYRKLVLEPGGSRPAAKLIESFLGRPFNLKAYQAWLQAY
jgi:thimet oligopeptidase